MTVKELVGLRELLEKPEVQRAMIERCDVEGHRWENCCSSTFQIYMKCEWCGKIKE